MIVLDLEYTDLDLNKCGIWQIGAIDLETREKFLEEARIDDEDEVSEIALKVAGKTEKELRDKNKQSQKKMIENFFKWIEKRKIKDLLCQGPQWDFALLTIKANKYGLKIPYPYKAFDLHTIAQIVYYKKHDKFLIKDNKSDMGLNKITEMVEIKDNRMLVKGGKIVKKGTPHNAIEDCKLEAECFSRLLNGKNLFPEYTQYKIPEELKK